MDVIFFDNWESIIRTFIITILAYCAMIFLLRSSGKRTLSKMNAFDFIVTIALGSALANVSLNKTVPLLDGVLAFFLLIFLQYLLTYLSVKTDHVKNLITSSPSLLLYKGEILKDVVKKERITKEELYLAARQNGCSSFGEIDAIILETTGDFTVIKNLESEKAPTMQDVKHFELYDR